MRLPLYLEHLEGSGLGKSLQLMKEMRNFGVHLATLKVNLKGLKLRNMASQWTK
jgi:hypothetical protein